MVRVMVTDRVWVLGFIDAHARFMARVRVRFGVGVKTNLHMLCYAMLCYAMLCYAVLCCAVLCCAVLCYVICNIIITSDGGICLLCHVPCCVTCHAV